MNSKELNLILKEGEGHNIEFKQQVDKSLSKELVAFSNSSGGKILLGVNDQGEKKGLKITNKLKSVVLSIARNCDPPIISKLESINNILIIEIPEGKNKPYQCKNGFFIRAGASTQKMKRDEILKFVVTESLVHFDKKINHDFDIKKHFSKDKFKEFLKLSNISLSEKKYKVILDNLGIGLLEKKKFMINNAGVLLFAKNPGKFFRHNFISCVLYKGKDKAKIIDRKDFSDDLISNYHNAITFLQRHLNLEYIIKGTGSRKELLEIPQEALRESLLNAIIHRDYYDQRLGIFVEIFDNRVEITNKGKLLFDKKYLGKISFPRNLLLFDLFHRMGLIEKVGSGISRIKSTCRKRHTKLKLDTGDFFITVFYRKKSTSRKKNLGQKLSQVCPKSVPTNLVVTILNKSFSPISITELMEAVEQTNRTRFRDQILKPLMKEKLIKMTISDKPTSSKQQYVITDKGRKVIEKAEGRK